MDLHEIVEALGNTREEYEGIRKLEGYIEISGQVYHYKAYKIGPPHDIIRIDLSKSSVKEAKE